MYMYLPCRAVAAKLIDLRKKANNNTHHVIVSCSLVSFCKWEKKNLSILPASSYLYYALYYPYVDYNRMRCVVCVLYMKLANVFSFICVRLLSFRLMAMGDSVFLLQLSFFGFYLCCFVFLVRLGWARAWISVCAYRQGNIRLVWVCDVCK